MAGSIPIEPTVGGKDATIEPPGMGLRRVDEHLLPDAAGLDSPCGDAEQSTHRELYAL